MTVLSETGHTEVDRTNDSRSCTWIGTTWNFALL